MKLSKPKNQTAEVLYELICQKSITRKTILETTGILNLTARISELRLKYFIDVVCQKVETTNKHNRTIFYGKWYLPEIGKQNIIEKYNKINHEI